MQHCRLPGSNLLFGLPVVLDTDSEAISEGQRLLLTHKGRQLAVLDVESKWAPNKVLEAKQCYGSTSLEHPGVNMIAMERGRYYLGGRVHGLELPQRWVRALSLCLVTICSSCAVGCGRTQGCDVQIRCLRQSSAVAARAWSILVSD